jgi:hypothetical protein
MLSNFFDIEEETFETKISKFVEHMDMVKSMDVREHTLYKKYHEINHHYQTLHNRAGMMKAKIWRPTDWNNAELVKREVLALRPKLRFIEKDDRAGIDEWTTMRVFCSSFEFDQNPGRFLRFFLENEEDGKLLGLTSLGSDVMNLGGRDKWVGWTDERKESGGLNHTAIGTTIVATQPFGYNFLGGKLLASMLATQYVRDIWKRDYNEALVGLTTTSLYGDGSMYNGIKWWKSMGESSGKISLKPDDEMYKVMLELIKERRPEKYKSLLTNSRGQPGTGVKQKIMNLIFSETKIKASKYQHGFHRGVYFCPMYDNTKEFLLGDISEDKLQLKANLARDIDDVLDWWKPKAINRYNNLIEQNRINTDILFYNDVMFMTWDEVKSKYLRDVGR